MLLQLLVRRQNLHQRHPFYSCGKIRHLCAIPLTDRLPKHRILPGDQVKVNSKKGRIKVVKMAPEREDSDQWQQGSTHKEYDAIENQE